MEANEAFRRIVVRHRWLIVLLVIIPLVAVVPWRLSRPASYAASVQVEAQAASPQVVTEAAAILSRMSSVAVSPRVVGAAVRAAHLTMPQGWVPSNAISATSVGGSAVIVLTVTDLSSNVALALARALGPAVVDEVNRLGTQQTASAMASLDQQAQQLTANRNALLGQLKASNSSSSGLDSVLADLSAINSQISQVMSAQQQLLTSTSANTSAGVISLPDKVSLVSSGLKTYAVLAGLLGVILGLLAATIHEVVDPSIADAASAARELNAPVLGGLEAIDGELVCADLAVLTRIALAARRFEVGTLVLAGSPDTDKLAGLADGLNRQMEALSLPSGVTPRATSQVLPVPFRSHLDDPANGEGLGHFTGTTERILIVSNPTFNQTHGPRRGGPGRLRAVSVGDITPGSGLLSPALLAVVSDFAPHADLDAITDLVATAGWPILGVIGMKRKGRRERRHDRRNERRRGKRDRRDEAVRAKVERRDEQHRAEGARKSINNESDDSFEVPQPNEPATWGGTCRTRPGGVLPPVTSQEQQPAEEQK